MLLAAHAVSVLKPCVICFCLHRYRTAVEEVPTGDYVIPLGQARVAREGFDVTIVTWGQQVAVAERAVSQLPSSGSALKIASSNAHLHKMFVSLSACVVQQTLETRHGKIVIESVIRRALCMRLPASMLKCVACAGG